MVRYPIKNRLRDSGVRVSPSGLILIRRVGPKFHFSSGVARGLMRAKGITFGPSSGWVRHERRTLRQTRRKDHLSQSSPRRDRTTRSSSFDTAAVFVFVFVSAPFLSISLSFNLTGGGEITSPTAAAAAAARLPPATLRENAAHYCVKLPEGTMTD